MKTDLDHLPPQKQREIDRLSPNNLPRVADAGLTGGALRGPEQADRVQRRSFSEDEKRAIAMQTLEPHVTVSQVARRHGIAASLLFRWRAQLGLGAGEQARLVTVRVEENVR